MPSEAMNLSSGAVSAELVGNPLSNIAVTEESGCTVHESDTLPKKTASQASVGKLEPVKVSSVSYESATEVTVICLVAAS